MTSTKSSKTSRNSFSCLVLCLQVAAAFIYTDNIYLEKLVQRLQQLAYDAENLLDELDYYRLKDQVQQRGTKGKENCSNKLLGASSSSGHLLASCSVFSAFEMLYTDSAPYAPVPLPETPPSIINLSRRMNGLAKKLQKYLEKVQEAVKTELLVKTTQNTVISQTEATNLTQTSLFHIETREVVGRNTERDQLLLNLLTNEESATVGKVLVLAIVGCGGLGKTTLAGLVYNDPNVTECFDIRSWICVSTHFDIFRLTREMLEGACDNRYDGLSNLEVLQKKLKDKLESKSFLLVLDDMWEGNDQSQWDKMIALLNNCMVKRAIILVTTRNQGVVNMVDASDTIYLEGLDEDVFLSFFSTCIFNNPNYGGNWRLRNIGKQIAKELKGNPLAAKTVSALLKKNPDERYWSEIRDSAEWKSQNGPNDIMPTLQLSYERMPFHLQRCFSYCAILPEDHPFTCEELVHLWMSQGYLDVRSKGKRMEDIGRDYFDDLFNRGFFQTIEYDNVRYTFHDLIHALACVVSFRECFSINGAETKEIPQTIRHLSIFISTKMAETEEQIVTALDSLEGENLGTIFNRDELWDELPSRIFCSILDLLKKTKFVRAVRLNLRGLKQLHNCNFQNFVSLRYLNLIISDFNNCKTLLKDICRLYHLEVLEINCGYLTNICELPNNFSDLMSLRYFIDKTGNKLHSMVCGVGKLTSLQELNYFHVQQNNGFEIEQLGSLKEIGGSLQISNLENVKSEREANKARLAEKGKLGALRLKWNHGEQENESVLEGLKPNTNLKLLEIDGYGGVASPTWLDPSLIFLESLTLENCKAWELLPPIGELEFLKHLKLSEMVVREIGPQCYGSCQSMKFQSLEELEIRDMPDLEKWVWSDQLEQFICFKKLKKLRIQDCPKLVDLPLLGSATSEVLERFPSLESLEIEGCPLIFQLPPLPYSSLLSSISIQETKFIESMCYKEESQELSLILDQNSSLKVVEVLAFHELSSLNSLMISHIPCLESFHELSFLRDLHISDISSMESFHENLVIPHLHTLRISDISSLESLDLHSFVALTYLEIRRCQSLTSLTFGDQLLCLKTLKIVYCQTLSSIKGLKSWVNMTGLQFDECPGFIAAWDSASKEIQSTEPDFSLSLIEITGDSPALLTLPICKQLTSLQCFSWQFSAFTEEHEISPQFLTSIDLVDIEGCKKNLQSFPYDLFPSLKELDIHFLHIQIPPRSSLRAITEECKKIRNIEEVRFFDIEGLYAEIRFVHYTSALRQQMEMDADN